MNTTWSRIYIYPLLDIYWNKIKIPQKDTCSPMFPAALFTVAQYGNKLTSLMNERMRKMWYTYTKEYYSVTKKKQILLFVIKSNLSCFSPFTIIGHLYTPLSRWIQETIISRDANKGGKCTDCERITKNQNSLREEKLFFMYCFWQTTNCSKYPGINLVWLTQ